MEFFFFGLFILFLMLLPVYRQLRNLRKHQEETSKRFTSQLHAVYDAVNLQRKRLEQVLAERPAEPADHAAAAPSPAGPGETIPIPSGTVLSRSTDQAEENVAATPPVPGSPVVTSVSGLQQQPLEERSASEAARRQLAAARLKQAAAQRESLPPTPPRVPSRFEAAAKDVLQRIWNWIIVGEEHIPEGVSVEFAIASQWLLRIGILLLVIGIGFFLKYSIEHGLISEPARVMLSVAAGLVMLISGIKILGGRFHVMGQGLLGGGIATLYFSAFAASSFYHLIEMPMAFAAMILVTALAGFIAVRFHSKLTAVLGVIGGYGTPVMLSTGQVNFPGLYGYMLVLGLGVLGICAWKRWPLLNYLSFAANFMLVGASLKGYVASEHFWQVMPFLIAFFMLFSTMVFIYNLFNRTTSNVLDVLVLFFNAGLFFALSYWLIEKSFSEKWVAAVTLGLTAFYIAHVWYCLVRRVLDRELMLGFTALAAFFLAITVPLLLSREWITVSWAVQAFVMLWLAGKLNSKFLRHVAYLLYLLVMGRFMFLDLPSQYGRGTLADLPLSVYLLELVERLVMFGVPIGSMALGYRMLTKPGQVIEHAFETASDIGGWVEERLAAKTAVYVVLGMLFVYLHLELNRTLGAWLPPLRLPVLTLIWLSVCLLLLLEYARTAGRIVLGFLCGFVAATLLKLLLFDLPAWSASSRFLYEGGYAFADAAFRLLDFGAIIVFFAFATRLLQRQMSAHQEITRQTGVVMGVSGLGMLFLYLTLELNSFLFHYVPNLRSGGISILWTLFALAFLIRGIARNEKAIRYAGLALFVVVTWKVFFIDLARLDQLYRIVAFIILGGLVLFGSFLYLRSRHTFATAAESPESSAHAASHLSTSAPKATDTTSSSAGAMSGEISESDAPDASVDGESS